MKWVIPIKTESRRYRNLNRAVAKKEIESVINNLLKEKIPGSDSFTDEFYQTHKENERRGNSFKLIL